MNNNMPVGIYNRNSHCFLNAVLQCLTSILYPFQIVPQNQFSLYLLETLKYIYDARQTANLDLFWCTLSDLRPQLFSKHLDQQVPQDAQETLLWIIEEAQLDLFKFKINDVSNILQIYYNDDIANLYLIIDTNINLIRYPTSFKIQDVVDILNLEYNSIFIAFISSTEDCQQIYNLDMTVGEVKANIQKQNIYFTKHPQPTNTLHKIQFIFKDNRSPIILMSLDQLDYEKEIFQLLKYQFIECQQVFCDYNQGDYYSINEEQVENYQFIIKIFLERGESLQDFLTYRLKNMKISKFPEYFMISINRCRVDDNGNLVKDSKILKYYDRFEAPPQYELMAIINHCGQDFEGHCTSFCKRDHKWYCMDNEDVSSIDDYVSGDAYVLMYKLLK